MSESWWWWSSLTCLKFCAVVPGKIIDMVNKNIAVKKAKNSKTNQLEKKADVEEFNFTKAEVEEWAKATVELRRAVDEQFSMAVRSLPRSKSTSVCTPNPIVIHNLQAWSRRARCVHPQSDQPMRPISWQAQLARKVRAMNHRRDAHLHLLAERRSF